MTDTMQKNPKELVFTRIFDAPREKVWEVWTEPEMIKKWWGPKDFTAPSIEIDLREGGKYLYCMRGEIPGQGEKEYWSGGIFQEIRKPEKIVAIDYLTDEKGNKVTPAYYGTGSDNEFETTVEVMFEEQGDKTKFNLRYPDTSRFNEKDISDMQMGWNQSLDKVEDVLRAM